MDTMLETDRMRQARLEYEASILRWLLDLLENNETLNTWGGEPASVAMDAKLARRIRDLRARIHGDALPHDRHGNPVARVLATDIAGPAEATP